MDGLTGNIKWTFPDNAASAIGSDGTVYVSAWGATPTVPGKLYALDGASGSNKWEFQTGDEASGRLIDVAKQRGAPDNVTVVLAYC